MESGKRKISGREKNEASIQLLEKLQEQLHSTNASIRRRAAFNLSWMQEDGLDILKEILLGNVQVTTKNAAAYGLRKMQGRMKKKALEVLKQGLTKHNSSTSEICRNALQLLGHEIPAEFLPKKRVARRSRIREIPRKTRPRRTIGTK
jgi:HEAT repeat protein